MRGSLVIRWKYCYNLKITKVLQMAKREMGQLIILRFLKNSEISDFADKNPDYTDRLSRPLEVFQRPHNFYCS